MFTSKVDITRGAQVLEQNPSSWSKVALLVSSNYHLTLGAKQDDHGIGCQSNYSIFITAFVTSILILVKLKSL